MTKKGSSYQPKNRLRAFGLFVFVSFLVVLARLFYWQILSGSNLQALADVQHQSTVVVPASRGEILASDGFPLVSNQAAYLVFAYMPDVDQTPDYLSFQLKELLAPTAKDIGATPSAEVAQTLVQETYQQLQQKLNRPELSWIPLNRRINQTTKDAVTALNLKGIGFDAYQIRDYPEASMAAQLLGFVGSDGTGDAKGYFGLEGYYDLELTGKPGLIRQEKDASGRPIIIGEFDNIKSRPGRTLKTHLNRSLQLLIEKELEAGIQKYQASSGEVTLMDPKTGAIIAMAASPSYDPVYYKQYDSQAYKIPSISDAFEPGSIFKVIVMAAAIDKGVIEPETTCDSTCDGPVTIGKYTIRTWNDQYHSGQTMTDVLRHSDNTGMIFAARKLGKDAFVDTIKSFGFGSATNIDLESETIPQLREKWGDIDLATGSFGQGIAITSIQMLQAVAAIANGGQLMQPQVVDQVITESETLDIAPKVIRQVISPQTASKVAQMMVASAQKGEAQWAFKDGQFQIAGKTGTAQIPIQGHYDTEKTIASFVGFAPANDPKFVMLVKLREPQASPWASETAAPLWMKITQDIFNQYDLQGGL